jgi:hypothetical protein
MHSRQWGHMDYSDEEYVWAMKMQRRKVCSMRQRVHWFHSSHEYWYLMVLRIWRSVDGGISCFDILYLDKILLPPDRSDSRRGDKCSIRATKLASWWWIVVLPQIVAKASEVSLNDPRSSETTTSNPRSFGPVSLRRRCQTWGRQRCAEWSKVMARPSGFPGQMRCGTACHWWALRLWKVWHVDV